MARTIFIKDRRIVRIGQSGRRGQNGVGIPTGGEAGEVLAKKSDTNYDTEWVVPPTAPVTSVNGETGDVVLDASDVNAIESIQAGTNVSIDSTDPQNPIINASGGGGAVDSVNGQTGTVVLDASDIQLVAQGPTTVEEGINTVAFLLVGKANDNEVVKLAGDQTIGGTKTFSGRIVANERIGVNTASPQELLHINGNARATMYIGNNVTPVNDGNTINFHTRGWTTQANANAGVRMFTGAIAPQASGTWVGLDIRPSMASATTSDWTVLKVAPRNNNGGAVRRLAEFGIADTPRVTIDHTGDIELHDSASGVIMNDRSDGKKYRLFFDNGVLNHEEVV